MSPNGLHHSQLQHISSRSIIPLLPSDPQYYSYRTQTDIPDPSNVQGDVYLLLPKKHETFIFFSIDDVNLFKQNLASYDPTTSQDVMDNLGHITRAKERASHPSTVEHVTISQSQIAFTRLGLNILGEKSDVKDFFFDKGSMSQQRAYLGDTLKWHKPFVSGHIHGVIIVAASHSHETEVHAAEELFQSSMTVLRKIHGNARPGSQRGHEHFGWEDGVSQPALRGLVKPHKGQLEADAGVVIMGYKGDPEFDHPNNGGRPDWTKDGTLMVFRKLEQDVLGFNDYLRENGPYWREWLSPEDVNQISSPLSDEEGAELFGARMVGRWKSGTPIALAPYRDDPAIAEDPEMVNNFDYAVKGNNHPSDLYCPFNAHTRKTAPRNMPPYADKKKFESALVVRAGLPYGPEVSDAPQEERGLLFVCYQSSLANGFMQQTRFAGQDTLPYSSVKLADGGQDPIIGNVDPYFVSSHGGEYFFVPSVSTLRHLAGHSDHKSRPKFQATSSPLAYQASPPLYQANPPNYQARPPNIQASSPNFQANPPNFQSSPSTSKGVHRIKLSERNADLYWELIADYDNPWVKLCPLDPNNDRQKWIITPLAQGNGYYINSVYNNSGLVDAKRGYPPYGYIIPDSNRSDVWIIREETVNNESFARIKVAGKDYPVGVSQDNTRVVRFYGASNSGSQRWVFGRV